MKEVPHNLPTASQQTPTHPSTQRAKAARIILSFLLRTCAPWQTRWDRSPLMVHCPALPCLEAHPHTLPPTSSVFSSLRVSSPNPMVAFFGTCALPCNREASGIMAAASLPPSSGGGSVRHSIHRQIKHDISMYTSEECVGLALFG